MECMCPKCLRTTDVDMDRIIISAEEAEKILGRNLREARVHCKYCDEFVVVKIPKSTEIKVILC